jgi:hypothetical protein
LILAILSRATIILRVKQERVSLQILLMFYQETLNLRMKLVRGYYYRTNTLGTAYKLMSFQAVETLTVDNYQNEFARCPKQGSACSGANPLNKTYSVYSAGAEGW